ncbi:MAG: 50S ribosomal protein L5 [Candidatus Margulisbacteria bacterium]|nr:50S ribosomal protein L5 [Candidatus Margulisiibacteriota bacterium]MBU1616544.1 50S ribosomal protein L5 [Candidatus Margulisiibacteriota bacterium]MBU1866956.1 50S ribosomal protein L5 [Candidatus Margulisiibacteriota bacterium]
MKDLQQEYQKHIIKKLQDKHKYANVMSIPRLKKVVINRGVGEARENAKAIDVSAAELSSIVGQKPLIINSKKAIAAFKLKGNIPIGLKVTLRGKRMWQFLNKLISISLPKIRDFKGVNPKSFDGRGNYSLGIKEQLIFPEVDYNKVDAVRGMDITFVTTAKTDAEARDLLEAFGIPFRTHDA